MIKGSRTAAAQAYAETSWNASAVLFREARDC